MDGDIVASLVFWPAILLLALWYVRRKKASHISTLRAYLIFLGVLGGGGLLLLVIVVGFVMALDPALQSGTTKALAPLIAICGLLPLWRLAHRKITD
jgi:hypothetical protein